MLLKTGVDTAEAVKCPRKTHEGATEWTHARTREVRSIPGEEQEMRVDACTTNVTCNVGRCMCTLIGPVMCSEEGARQG